MFTRALALATIAALTQSASAQCEEWLPTPGSSSIGLANQLVTVDHDGPGPRPAMLYASGTLPGPTPVNSALAWDGARWTAIAAFPSSPNALFSVDEPAAGVPAGTLLVGSSVSTGPLGATRFLCAWDGQSISSIGPTDMAGFSSGATVRAITTWDPDGPGPQPPLVIVGGTFTKIGGVTANNIAAWNGSQWIPVGQGRPIPVTALISFDPDGEGPALPLLVTSAGHWNGATWNGGIPGTTNRFAVHDADADGPLLPELYATGNFSPDILARPPVLRWNGTAWVDVGTGLATRATGYDLQSIDFDGPGGQPPQLVYAGSPENTLAAVLQNGVWVNLPSIPNVSSPSGRSMVFADPDADGPRANELIIAGNITLFASTPFFKFNGPVTWNGQRWAPLGSEFIGGIVYDFAWNDDDGEGPNPPQLYAGGSFRFAGGQPADGLARWDGARWVGLGTPAAEPRNVFRLDSFDPDGSGPQPPWLVAINSNVQAPMATMRWNGTAWTYVDQLYSGYQTMALRSFDDDGPGPLPPRLVVGGRMVRIPSAASGTIATFSTGPRFSITNINNFVAYTLFPHDTDGPGPLAPRLHAFLSDGFDAFIYQSDAATWDFSARAQFSNENYIPDAVSWDPDGDGPALPSIVVGASRINTGWGPSILEAKTTRQLGYNATEPTVVRRLASFDPDGPGPAHPQLLMGYGTGNGRGIKRLIGAEWTDMGSGLFNFASGGEPLLNYAAGFITIDPDNDGPLPPELWIGGSFTHANGQPAACFARWRLTGPLPVITQQPESQAPCSNTPTTLAVAADNAQTYQWRISDANSPLRWRALADGPVVIAGRYMGLAHDSHSSSFTFIPAADIATSFTCIVSSQCGAVITSPASLSTITTCCGSADFNHDANPGSDLDIEAFFACIAGRCCDTCDSIDFNADGDYATDADIEAFFRVLAGGNC